MINVVIPILLIYQIARYMMNHLCKVLLTYPPYSTHFSTTIALCYNALR